MARTCTPRFPKSHLPPPAFDAVGHVTAATARCMLDSAHPIVRTGVQDAVRDLLLLASQSPAAARALLAAWRDAHNT